MENERSSRSDVPTVEAGSTGSVRWWAVGPDRVELTVEGREWTARVVRSDWGGLALDVDGRFDDEAKAMTWCRRMADTLAADLDDEDERTGAGSAMLK